MNFSRPKGWASTGLRIASCLVCIFIEIGANYLLVEPRSPKERG